MSGYDEVSNSQRVTLVGSTAAGDIGDVDVTSVIPLTGATNLGKAVDNVAGASDVGVAALMVRRDTPATLTPADGDYARAGLDSLGLQWVHEYYAPAYEDNTNAVAKVEERFTSSYVLTSDTQVKGAAGFIHTVTISQNDAAPTAGTIDIYDNTSATGSKLFTWTLTTAVFNPFTVILNASCANGIYVDFTTTADVAVVVSYR